tara:strand:+ start:367 stop:1812 length:1446 start_codon:yes stop_codon:yes gene_type:complete
MKILILLLMPITSFAEVQTTDNLVVNGNFETGNPTGWTTNGDVQVLNDCCQLNNIPSNYDLEFGDDGSVEQDFNLYSDTITNQMLDNGITLNSVVEVQNGECAVSGCWGGQGGADSFTIRLQIKDDDSNVLANVSQTRTDVTGINGQNFTNSLSYGGTGSRVGNIFISGQDANAPATLGGANIDNISVTMDYDDTVLSASQVQELTTTFEEIEEIVQIAEEIIPEEIQEIFIEEQIFEELVVELYTELIEFEEKEQFIEEELIVTVLEEQIILTEEPQVSEVSTTYEPVTEVIETEMTITEELENEIVEEFEEKIVETNVEETIEEPTEEVSEEITEEPTEEVAETNTEEVEAEENTTQDETVAQEKEINIDDISAKVESKIKDVDKQIAVTQSIVAKLMTKDSSVSMYQNMNKEFFDNQIELSEINIDEYMNKEFIDDKMIYQDVEFSKDSLYQYNKDLSDIRMRRKIAEDNLRRIINGF